MNSLEFINQEIAFLEDMISMDLTLIEDEEDLKEIAKKQERLNHLKQIKSELEAWEVVKKHFEYHEGDVFNCFKEGFIQTTELNSKDFEIIKKVLEVKDA